MKLCPSCGAELADEEVHCPICEFEFEPPVKKIAEAPPPPPKDEMSVKLDEMRARISEITKETGSSTPIEDGQTVESASEEDQGPERTTDETGSDEPGDGEDGVEYEEIIEEIIIRPASKQKPGTSARGLAARQKGPAVSARKLSVEEVNKGKEGGKGKAIAAVCLVIILIIASWFAITMFSTPSEPAIGEGFNDWIDVVKYTTYFKSNDSRLNFLSSAVQYYEGAVFWYFETDSELYKPSDRMTYYMLFIDQDGDKTTGYSLFPDFGADMKVHLEGYGQERQSAQLFTFSGSDRNNWSAWDSTDPTLSAAELNKQAEVKAAMPSTFSSENARFTAIAADGISSPSATLPCKLIPGILLIRQASLVPETGIIPISDQQHVLSVRLIGFGKPLEISEIHPSISGVVSIESVGSAKWMNDAEMTTGLSFNVPINTSDMAVGTRAEVELASQGIVTDFPSIVVFGDPAIGYVQTKPSDFTIDGCFADWTVFDDDGNDVGAIQNPDIDIKRFSYASTSRAFFYVESKGEMFNGTFAPLEVRRILPTPPGPAHWISGEEVLSIYIDTNPGIDSGAPAPFNGSNLRPEYRIEIRGINGEISRKSLSEWTGGAWSGGGATPVSAAKDDKRIEISIEKQYFNSAGNSSVCIVFYDWKGTNDTFSRDYVHISSVSEAAPEVGSMVGGTIIMAGMSIVLTMVAVREKKRIP